MRAAWMVDSKQLEVRDLVLPDPGPEDVRVEVLGCGVCGSNLHDWHHPGPYQQSLCGAFGHEIVGRVDGLGDGVSTAAVGDVVVVDPSSMGGCSECSACRDGAAWFCAAKRPVPAYGFASHLITPVDALHAVPAGVSSEAAALTEPVACGVHGIRHSWTARGDGRIDGLDVVVIGAGALGLGSLLAANALGAGSTTVVARHQHQADAAAALGATTVLESDIDGLASELRRLRAPLVVEAVGGSGDTLRLAADVVAWRGEVVLIGSFEQPQALDVGRMVARETRLYAPVAYAARDGVHDIDVALQIIAATGDPVANLATHCFPLEAVDEAFRTADDKSTGAVRVLVGALAG